MIAKCTQVLPEAQHSRDSNSSFWRHRDIVMHWGQSAQ